MAIRLVAKVWQVRWNNSLRLMLLMIMRIYSEKEANKSSYGTLSIDILALRS
jgi:hypothetical protein